MKYLVEKGHEGFRLDLQRKTEEIRSAASNPSKTSFTQCTRFSGPSGPPAGRHVQSSCSKVCKCLSLKCCLVFMFVRNCWRLFLHHRNRQVWRLHMLFSYFHPAPRSAPSYHSGGGSGIGNSMLLWNFRTNVPATHHSEFPAQSSSKKYEGFGNTANRPGAVIVEGLSSFTIFSNQTFCRDISDMREISDISKIRIATLAT